MKTHHQNLFLALALLAGIHQAAAQVTFNLASSPGYTDTQAFPAAPAIWTYRAIYRVGDNQTGQWSLPVSVTVPA